MVNFGPKDTVPEAYKNRKLYVHNPFITLMRTTAEENEAQGVWIAEKLNRCEGPVRFLLPTGGVSMIDAPGQAFHDPEADEALFSALERTFQASENRQLRRIPHHINDDNFAQAVLEAFREVTA